MAEKEIEKEFHLAAMQKSVGIELEVEPDMPKVWIDREKMDHIIDNLLSNALKYTEKGAIHILVKTARKKWTIEVNGEWKERKNREVMTACVQESIKKI